MQGKMHTFFATIVVDCLCHTFALMCCYGYVSHYYYYTIHYYELPLHLYSLFCLCTSVQHTSMYYHYHHYMASQFSEQCQFCVLFYIFLAFKKQTAGSNKSINYALAHCGRIHAVAHQVLDHASTLSALVML